MKQTTNKYQQITKPNKAITQTFFETIKRITKTKIKENQIQKELEKIVRYSIFGK